MIVRLIIICPNSFEPRRKPSKVLTDITSRCHIKADFQHIRTAGPVCSRVLFGHQVLCCVTDLALVHNLPLDLLRVLLERLVASRQHFSGEVRALDRADALERAHSNGVEGLEEHVLHDAAGLSREVKIGVNLLEDLEDGRAEERCRSRTGEVLHRVPSVDDFLDGRPCSPRVFRVRRRGRVGRRGRVRHRDARQTCTTKQMKHGEQRESAASGTMGEKGPGKHAPQLKERPTSPTRRQATIRCQEGVR